MVLRVFLFRLAILGSVLWLTGCQSGLLIPPAVGAVSEPTQVTNNGPTYLPSATFLPRTAIPTLQTLTPTNTALPTLTRTSTPIPSITPTPAVVGVFGFQDNINPLTGLEMEDPSILDRRPVMVKVSNAPPSVRPQAGLSFADLVFEYYIGEGANRFLATYYGQDAKKAGSVRSGRLVDSQLVKMYQGILAYGSADPQVDTIIQEKLGERAISNLEAGCPSFCGSDNTHNSPWIYANTAEITRYANQKSIDNVRPRLNGMLFDAHVPESDQFGIKLGVEYGYARGEWHYDPKSGKYLRWEERALNPENMVPLTDRLTGDQLAFSNVIVMFAPYMEYAPTLHEIDVADNTRGDQAFFFRDGVMVKGSWRAVDPSQPIQFFNQYGLPMLLKPGNTWIVIAGINSRINMPEDGHWEIRFVLP
jgi:hypothetical protein